MAADTVNTSETADTSDTAVALQELLRVSPHLQSELLTGRLGIEITTLEPDRVVGTMPVDGNRQHHGVLHGGATAAFAETLGSIAGAVYGGADRVCVGIELSCSHHRPVRSGRVTGVCTPLNRGGQLATYEIVVSDERGRCTSTARLTCMLGKR